MIVRVFRVREYSYIMVIYIILVIILETLHITFTYIITYIIRQAQPARSTE